VVRPAARPEWTAWRIAGVVSRVGQVLERHWLRWGSEPINCSAVRSHDSPDLSVKSNLMSNAPLDSQKNITQLTLAADLGFRAKREVSGGASVGGRVLALSKYKQTFVIIVIVAMIRGCEHHLTLLNYTTLFVQHI